MKRKTKLDYDAELLPSDTRISLRGLFLIMAVVAIVAAVAAPFVRWHARDAQLRFFIVFGILLTLFLVTFMWHGWRRRRAELEAGPVLCQLSPASELLPRAPRMATIIGGMITLAFDFVVLGALGLLVVKVGGIASPALIVCGLYYIYSGRTMGTDGVSKLWWGDRIRICEHGIVDGEHVVSWSECDEYYWDGDRPNVLVLYWRGGARHNQFESEFALRRRPWHGAAAKKMKGCLVAFVPKDKRRVLELLLEDVVRKSSGFTHETSQPA